MHDDFLARYLGAFDSTPGWFSPDACLMFMAYHQLGAMPAGPDTVSRDPAALETA